MGSDLIYLVMQVGSEVSIIAGPFPEHDEIDTQLCEIMEDELEGVDAEGVNFACLVIDPNGQYPMVMEDIHLPEDVDEEEDEDVDEAKA